MDDNRTSLPLSGAAALVALLAPTFDRHGPPAQSFPVMIEKMIWELRHSSQKQPEDDEAIKTLLLVQRYLYLVETGVDMAMHPC